MIHGNTPISSYQELEERVSRLSAVDLSVAQAEDKEVLEIGRASCRERV